MLPNNQAATDTLIPILDLTRLPLSAHREIVDFYEFLIQKYPINEQKECRQKSGFQKFLDNPIQLAKLHPWTRDELHGR